LLEKGCAVGYRLRDEVVVELAGLAGFGGLGGFVGFGGGLPLLVGATVPPAAVAALIAWDGKGEPEGWFRHPMSGRRRPDGDASREYTHP
jgi:hypothetical protein